MNPYGCHNITRKSGHWAQNGWRLDEYGKTAIAKLVWIENKNTKECQYRKEVTDPRCEGCRN